MSACADCGQDDGRHEEGAHVRAWMRRGPAAVPSGPRDDRASGRAVASSQIECDIAEVIHEHDGVVWSDALDLAARIVPIAEARAVARAQQELRAAAEWLRTTSLDKVPGPPAVWRHLDARADALGDQT